MNVVRLQLLRMLCGAVRDAGGAWQAHTLALLARFRSLDLALAGATFDDKESDNHEFIVFRSIELLFR